MRIALVMLAACAASSPVAVGNHVAAAPPRIRLAHDGELGVRPRECQTAGGFRPDLGERIRAFVAGELRPGRIVREVIVELPSQGTLDQAAANLGAGDVALVVEPRDTLGMLWVVHAKFEAIYCVHVRGDELVLEQTVTRITRALE